MAFYDIAILLEHDKGESIIREKLDQALDLVERDASEKAMSLPTVITDLFFTIRSKIAFQILLDTTRGHLSPILQPKFDSIIRQWRTDNADRLSKVQQIIDPYQINLTGNVFTSILAKWGEVKENPELVDQVTTILEVHFRLFGSQLLILFDANTGSALFGSKYIGMQAGVDRFLVLNLETIQIEHERTGLNEVYSFLLHYEGF